MPIMGIPLIKYEEQLKLAGKENADRLW